MKVDFPRILGCRSTRVARDGHDLGLAFGNAGREGSDRKGPSAFSQLLREAQCG